MSGRSVFVPEGAWRGCEVFDVGVRKDPRPKWDAGPGVALLARRLQRFDAWRLLVVHDEGAVVQLCDAGVELAQQLEHARLVGLLFLLVEPAGQVMRVKLVIRIEQFADFSIQRSHDRVLVNQRQDIGRDASSLLAGPDGAMQELVHDLDSDHYFSFL